MGLSPEITAGAVISGAYFGDKMSPLSETTILVPSLVGGVTTAQHIRTMMWTVGPAIGSRLLIFLGISLSDGRDRIVRERRRGPGDAGLGRSTSRSSVCCRWSC